MLILGIDPGSLVLGYGVLRAESPRNIQYVDHGELKAKGKKDYLERLGEMALKVEALIDDVRPDVAVIEKIFLGRNVDSVFKLGHIRGVCVAKCLHSGARVFEYMPRLIKQGVTGSGGASKEQVRLVLYSQLGLRQDDGTLDASDALSLAYYHATHNEAHLKLKRNGLEL